MITFKKISIQNFMSFGNNVTEVDLEQEGSTLIIGDNKDIGDEGYSKNGVGKSTIFKALCWCLFDETPENIKQNDYINKFNKKNMIVQCEVDINGDTWEFTRKRKPNDIIITRNGNPETPHSIGESNDKIRQLLSMDLDVFSNTISLSTSNIPYMQMKPAPQRDFMEKFLNLNVLSERASTLKSEKSDFQTDIKLEERSIQERQANNERMRGMIEPVKQKIQSWDEQHQSILEESKEEIESIEQETDPDEMKTMLEDAKAIREKKSTVNELRKELQSVERSLQNERLKEHEKKTKEEDIVNIKQEINDLIDETQKLHDVFEEKYKGVSRNAYNEAVEQEKSLQNGVHEMEHTINGFVTEAENISKEIERSEKDKDEKENELKSLLDSTCPYCGQDYHDDEKINGIRSQIEDIERQITSMEGKAATSIDEAEKAKTNLEAVEGELRDHRESMKGLENTLSEMDSDQQAIRIKENEIETKTSSLHRMENELKTLSSDDSSELNQKAQELESNIASLEEEIDSSPYKDDGSVDQILEIMNLYETQVSRYNNEKDKTNPHKDELKRLKESIVEVDESNLKEWKKRVTHIDHLIKLLTDSKSFVRRNLINQYVPFINKQLNKYLEVLQLPHTVEINPDLTVDIYYLNETTSYGNLSGGERLRLNMATSFALRDINAVMGRSTNLMLIDEYLDNGLDQSGFKAVMRMIKRSDIDSVMVISHREEIMEMVDHVITVVKENGFTHLVDDGGMDQYRQI